MATDSDPPESSRLVLVEQRGGVVFVTLNRPEAMNALSRGLVTALAETLQSLRALPELRALILMGAGSKAFSAGADLKERRAMTRDQSRQVLGELNALMDQVAAFPVPVIAALNGVALGGGFELALACDLRIAAEGAQMGLVEVRLGIIPGAGGTQRLARVAGAAVAKELILTGRRIGAARARELGLVSQVVAAPELAAAAARLAAEIAEGGPLAVAQAKRAIDGGLLLPLKEGLALEQACYEVVLASEDRQEGLQAFAEKRRPLFKGK
jgi:enoyl-CoA hydratase/carnithine racemase